MADDGMDPCEYIWSHEMAMRRLLLWLRQSQSYCTDTECIDEFPASSGQLPGNAFIIMSLFVAFAMAMYFLRPGILRNRPDDMKPSGGNGGQGPNGMPPTPPPTTS